MRTAKRIFGAIGDGVLSGFRRLGLLGLGGDAWLAGLIAGGLTALALWLILYTPWS